MVKVMCTLMQKDVLIELIADARATISLRTSPQMPRNADQSFLSELRSRVYRTAHNDLDFEGLVEQVNKIKSKYAHQPIHQAFL